MGQVYYIKDIKKIDSGKFGPAKIAGKTIKNAAARNYVAKLATGGKTAGQIGEKLRKAGLRGDQWEKRLKYLKVIQGGGSDLSEKRIKANINRVRRQRMNESGVMTRGATYSKEFAGGRVKSHGVMGDIGIDVEKRSGKIGFAANYRNSQLPNNSNLKSAPGGIKPIIKLAA